MAELPMLVAEDFWNLRFVTQMQPAPDGRSIAFMHAHSTRISALAWSPDGTQIASAGGHYAHTDSSERFVQVWDPTSGALHFSCDAGQGVTSLAWSPDGIYLASGGTDGKIAIWDGITGERITQYETVVIDVHDVAWSLSHSLLVVGGENTYAEPGEPLMTPVVEALSGRVRSIYGGHSGIWANAVTWSPDSSRVASAADDECSVHIWDAATGTRLVVQPMENEVQALAWSPDGQRIAAGHSYGPITVLDAQTGAVVLSTQGDWLGTYHVAWSPDGRRLAAGDHIGEACIWDAASGELLITSAHGVPHVQGHTLRPYHVAWSPDGRKLALDSWEEQRVYVWTPQI